MYTYAFEKYASPVDVPLWVHIPGTPLTLPGRQTQYDRLPGMTDWAPQPVISRVAQGLQENVPLEEIAQSEGEQGFGKALGTGLLGGSVAGALTGRLLSGKAGTEPFKNILEKGLSRASLGGLRNLPKGMLALPLLGAGAGTLLGIGGWKARESAREQRARDVARGLLTERILQRHQLREATQNIPTAPFSQQLRPLPLNLMENTSGIQTAREPEAHRSVLGGGNP